MYLKTGIKSPWFMMVEELVISHLQSKKNVRLYIPKAYV